MSRVGADGSSERSVTAVAARGASAIAVIAIWVGSLVIALFSPDFVSGSAQEHLPLAALTCWPWAAAATGYVLMAARIRPQVKQQTVWAGFALIVTVVWITVALASVFAPELITGSDPTRIPLAALVTPVVGMVATGFASLYATTVDRDT